MVDARRILQRVGWWAGGFNSEPQLALPHVAAAEDGDSHQHHEHHDGRHQRAVGSRVSGRHWADESRPVQ